MTSAMILPTDVEDAGDSYHFIADVPGLEKGDIKVCSFPSPDSSTSLFQCLQLITKDMYIYTVSQIQGSTQTCLALHLLPGSLLYKPHLSMVVRNFPDSVGACNDVLLASVVQIRVNQEDRQLTISGERRRVEAADTDAKRRRRSERRFGKFERKFRLPKDADLEAVTARCVSLCASPSEKYIDSAMTEQGQARYHMSGTVATTY